MKPLKSCFAVHLTNYIELRVKLGFKFQLQADVLRAFDTYAHRRGHAGMLSAELVIDFATEDPDGSANKQARRYQVVRNFADYLATFEPTTPALDPKAMLRPKTRPPAYIYSEAELGRLLNEAKRLSRRHPIRSHTVHSMVGLAASTGLRISEVVHLDRDDVDLQNGILSVRCTKFAKDRLVPIHPSTVEVLRRYSIVRDAHYPGTACAAFFLTMRRNRYSSHTLQLDFWHLARRAGLREATGCGPRFHDLRHTFAVRRLVAWYKEGVDVQAMLPALATYLGHVHYSDTAYYLKATAELLGVAADHLQRSQEATR